MDKMTKTFSDALNRDNISLNGIRVKNTAFEGKAFLLNFEIYYKTFNLKALRFQEAKLLEPFPEIDGELFIDSYELTFHKDKKELRIALYSDGEEYESIVLAKEIEVLFERYPIETETEILITKIEDEKIYFECQNTNYTYSFNPSEIRFWTQSARIPTRSNSKRLKEGETLNHRLPPLPLKALLEAYYTEEGYCYLFRRIIPPADLKTEKKGYLHTFALETHEN